MAAISQALTEQAFRQPPNSPFKGSPAAQGGHLEHSGLGPVSEAQRRPPPPGPGSGRSDSPLSGMEPSDLVRLGVGAESPGPSLMEADPELPQGGEGAQWHLAGNKRRRRPDCESEPKRSKPQDAAGDRKEREGAKAPQDRKLSKIVPIILDGAPAASQLTLSKELARVGRGARFRRMTRLERGGVLVVPMSPDDGTKLLAASSEWSGDAFWGSTRAHYAGQTAKPASTKTSNDGTDLKRLVVAYGVDGSITDDELLTELTALSPIRVKRLQQPNGRGASPVLIELSDVDTAVKVAKEGIVVGCLHFRCRPYVERQDPVRCFKCQSFGHVAAACTRDQRCPRCGEAHSRVDCPRQEPPTCVNCEGPHSSAWKGCPKFREFAKQERSGRKSYAQATKTKAVVKEVPPGDSRSGQTVPGPDDQRNRSSQLGEERIVTFITAVIVACRSKSRSSDIVTVIADLALGILDLTFDGSALYDSMQQSLGRGTKPEGLKESQ